MQTEDYNNKIHKLAHKDFLSSTELEKLAPWELVDIILELRSYIKGNK